MEHTIAFSRRIVVDTMLVHWMVRCRNVVQEDYFGWVQICTIFGIVVAKMVVDKMAL